MKQTERDIIESAIRVFAADAQAPLTKVAKEAGVSRMTLARYFPCRNSLVKNIDHYLIVQAEESFDRAVAASDDPLQQLKCFFDSRMSRIQGHLVLMKLNDDFFDDHHPKSSACAGINERMFSLLKRLRAAQRIRPEIPDAWVIHMLHSTVFAAWVADKTGTVAPRDIPVLAWQSFWRAIAADGTTEAS